MHSLICICFCFFLIHFCAGGLVNEALFASAVILNYAAAVKLYVNGKKNHLCDLKITLSLLALVLSISYFYLPLSNLFSNTASSYYITQNILMEGAQLGLFQNPEFNFKNSLNYLNSVKFLLLLLNLIPLCYLTATLRNKHKFHLIYVLCFIACLNVMAAFYQNYIRDTGGLVWWVWRTSANKTIGSFVNPNHFGAFCAALMGLPVSVFFSSLKKKELNKVPFAIISLAILIAGVMLSGSLGAYFLGVLSLVYAYYISSKKVNNGPLKTFSIISTILVFSIFTPTQIEGEIHERGLIGSQRQELYETSPAILKTFPQGIGPGSYKDISPSYTGSLSQKVIFHHNENTFLHFLVEMGPLFCLTLIILNYFIFNKIISNVHNSKVDKKLCSVAACGILISFCHAAYDYGFHIPAYSFNIAIFYGLLLCKGKNYEDRDNSIFIKKLSRITFLFPVIAIIGLWFLYHEQRDFLKYQDKSEVKSIDYNVQILTHRPLSAIHWFALGSHILKQGDDFIFMDYSEKCFKMAAHNSPISRTYWYKLFAIRDQLGRDSDAKNAYLFYFKLLEKNERLKRKSEAMDVLELNQKDFEELLYHQHIPTNFNKNYFRKI